MSQPTPSRSGGLVPSDRPSGPTFPRPASRPPEAASRARSAPEPERTRGPASGLVPELSPEAIDAALLPALDEDGIPRAGSPAAPAAARAAAAGRRVDLSSQHAVPEEAEAVGRLVAKASGVLCGVGIFARAVEVCALGARVEVLVRDGERVEPGREVLRARGRARGLLFAERTGLNFVQRLSGVATATAAYVERCAGRARVLDTRKTTPGLRVLEKYAVRCGGGTNHRFGLYDEAMVKNNHADLAGKPLLQVLRDLRAALGPSVRITSEARDLQEAAAGVEGDADVVLLDNFPPAALAAAVPELRARARGRQRPLELEASGGITLANVADVAASGVDRISIGALTHSAPALDFSFYLRPA